MQKPEIISQVDHFAKKVVVKILYSNFFLLHPRPSLKVKDSTTGYLRDLLDFRIEPGDKVELRDSIVISAKNCMDFLLLLMKRQIYQILNNSLIEVDLLKT